MANKVFLYLILILSLTLSRCQQSKKLEKEDTANQMVNLEEEEKAILKTLNSETEAAFQRAYAAWKENWVHDPDISKIYIDFADSTFSESIGWEDISGFVKEYIEEHPEPEPVLKLLNDIDVRLYGNGAWVTYQQKDSLRGLKRETRLMEKVNGKWKIAGMQTTIYGSEAVSIK